MIKLLVVDDNDQNRYMAQVLFSRSGYQVELASNGVEALEKARQDPPGLIVADILMPVMDGFALCREWKQDQVLKSIPFLFYTATYTDPEDEKFALSIGADRFLVKPLDTDQLLAVVRETITQFQQGRLPSGDTDIPEEDVYLKQYNQALIHKLEDKLTQLEATNQRLQNEIEERLRIEANLRSSESIKGAIIRSSLDCIITVDDQGHIIEFNPAAEVVFRHSRQDALGMDISRLVLLPGLMSSPSWKDFWMINGDSIRDRRLELRAQRADNCEFPVEVTVTSIPIENRILCALFLRDISMTRQSQQELRRLESQLVQAQKMEAIGTLAGGIAHDFNNILSAIMGYTEIAMLNADSGIPSGHHLEEALKACNRAKELVMQILTFSRQTDMDRKPVRVKPIVKEVLKLLRASLPATIDIRQNLESESLIMGNPTQIYQVMMNLCTNASYAMKSQGGILDVMLSDVALDSAFVSAHNGTKAGAYQKLVVNDNGIGMPPDQMERIFQPFFTTKQKGEGTGLGLSVVHDIVKNAGGIITVSSTPRTGSTFAVYFPVIEQVTDPDTLCPQPPAGGNERVLFIDDEATLIEIGVQMLEKLGYHVTAVQDSKKALDMFKVHPEKFDLIITDMTMPGLTGVSLTRELTRIRPDLPVILCTGFSNDITETSARQAGIKSLLMKPFVITDLARTIRKVIDGDDCANLAKY